MTDLKAKFECPRAEIVGYIDGELAPAEELALEVHIAGCGICSAELNIQKNLLFALDSALDDDGVDAVEVPPEFARIVTVNAESNLRGLRCPRERSRAMFVAVALLLLAVVGLGADASRTFEAVGVVSERIVAVLVFFGRWIADAAFAVVLILQSLFAALFLKSAFSATALALLFVVSVYLLSRVALRQPRS